MIVITGATGTLGRIVVEEALKVYPANELGVSVRNASKAQDLADKGVSVR
ncbi:SDR family oxidoreductase, partial [Staphylococcus simulans]